ncbi:MAG: hypothetical protein H7343_22415 [Undibacterium sp.]|nr:hypothetical protein [Opitutaceae bacterium]
MKVFAPRSISLALVGVACAVSVCAATTAGGDVAPIAKRRPTVELAQRLAVISPPAPLPADAVLPFNPVAFGQPNPEEQRAIDQALANQQALTATAPAGGAQAKPGATDREQLAAIAARIPVKATIFVGISKEPNLVIGNKFYKIGSKFTVAYSGIDYALELTAIDSTTFTLRLNGEAITRPIKSAAKTSP